MCILEFYLFQSWGFTYFHTFLPAPCFFIDWHPSLTLSLISHWPLQARWGLPCTLCFSYHSAQVSFALFGFPGMPLAFFFLLWMVYAHVHVCTQSMYLCAHVRVCTCTCVHMEAKGQCHMSFSINFPPISLVQGPWLYIESGSQAKSPTAPPVFSSHHPASF